MNTERDKQLLSITNASGFPFQLRVANLVETTSIQYGWRVLVREHPWNNPETGEAGFIDMILARDHVRLVVECKRVQQGQWVFLLPPAASHKTFARSFATLKVPDWVNCAFEPLSAESSFCVVRGTGEKDRPLLERLAACVSCAAESFGRQELTVERNAGLDIPTIYVPVIVSNVELVACDSDPAQIDVTTGSISPGDASFATIPLIRFRKPLTPRIDLSRFSDVSSVNRDAERTVFVINAGGLPEFLKDLRFRDLLPDSPRAWHV